MFKFLAKVSAPNKNYFPLVLKKVLSPLFNSLLTSFENGEGHLDNISATLLWHVWKVLEDISRKEIPFVHERTTCRLL